MQKFLIIQTAFIGDVILSSSLIENIHQEFPNAKIDFLLRKGNEAIFENHPHIHDLLIWNKKESKYSSLFEIFKKIRRRNYDYVINLQRFASTGFLTAFSNSQNRIGFAKNPFSIFFTHKIDHEIGNQKHEIERNHELIVHLTQSSVIKPKLYPSIFDVDKVQNLINANNLEKDCHAPLAMTKYVCIAPTSVWFTKQLPKEQWIKLIQNIDSNTNIYLLGSRNDFEKCEEILKNSNRKNIQNLAGKLKILETAVLMKNAEMNFVNDSAPMHIASAMNANTTAFFCSTLPKFGFTPLSENSKIVEIESNLECRPCGLHGKNFCKENHFKCGYDIDVTKI